MRQLHAMNSTAPARRWLREVLGDLGPRMWAMFVVMTFAGALAALGIATGQQASSSPTESAPESATESTTDSSTASTTESPRAPDKATRAQSALDTILNPRSTSTFSTSARDSRETSAQNSAKPARSTHNDAATSTRKDANAEPTSASIRESASTSTFNGRPIRIARTIRMKVTAYSPDAQSCGASADGITASGYSVFTNGGNLVAADPKLLPLGSIVSIPGYAGDAVVPVLDVGGAIKGNKLDVLYATHARARQWGVQELEVIVWEYADGQPSGFKRLRRNPK